MNRHTLLECGRSRSKSCNALRSPKTLHNLLQHILFGTHMAEDLEEAAKSRGSLETQPENVEVPAKKVIAPLPEELSEEESQLY